MFAASGGSGGMASVRRLRHARVANGIVVALVVVGPLLVAACSSGNGVTPRNLLQGDYEHVVRGALPSVVEIITTKSTGSGVVFDTKGDIVTNAHVIGAATTFDVFTSGMSKPLPARLVGLFAPDDLAVIKVTKGASDLVPARWADSSKAQIGDIVLAMGAPYGLIDSVTQGIVSATGRTVTGPTISGQPPTVIVDAIQTSAAINPGNSGGALVLLTGRVIGIPTLSAVDPNMGGTAQGIGFAIPANTVRDIAKQLIETGKVTRSGRASLEITGQTHTDTTGVANGVTVISVQPGGSAAKAGIRAGDVIAGMQGKATPDLTALETALTQYQPGQEVTVEALRNGNPRQVTVRLGMLIS
jgi:putative serine protease PepD